MTTYTKTQLIDMAISKLGENPEWMVDSVCVAVSTESNTVWGSGKFILISKKGQTFWESLVHDSWQLVCTREEFEQRVAERKVVNKPKEWEYCPECGSYEVSYEEGIHKQCADCSQEWFSDIDYTDVVRSHLQDNYLGEAKPTIQWWDYEKNESLDFPPAGTECETLYLSNWCRTVVVGLDSKGKCVFESAFLKDSYCYAADVKMFRPLDYKSKLTERQQAGLKLWRAINFKGTESDEFIISQERFEDYCLPFDQGLLK